MPAFSQISQCQRIYQSHHPNHQHHHDTIVIITTHGYKYINMKPVIVRYYIYCCVRMISWVSLNGMRYVIATGHMSLRINILESKRTNEWKKNLKVFHPHPNQVDKTSRQNDLIAIMNMAETWIFSLVLFWGSFHELAWMKVTFDQLKVRQQRFHNIHMYFRRWYFYHNIFSAPNVLLFVCWLHATDISSVHTFDRIEVFQILIWFNFIVSGRIF